MVVMVEFPPGAQVDPHTHTADYVEVVIAGSQMVTGRWHHAGDLRTVRAGTGYGPLVAGPEGATVMLIFSRGDAQIQEFSKDSANDRANEARSRPVR